MEVYYLGQDPHHLDPPLVSSIIFDFLVGAGESGKSTIVKQMKILHQGGYSDV